MKNEIINGTKERIYAIQIRTIILTLVILVALSFYIILSVAFKTEINVIDLIITASIGVATHCTYFPDGQNHARKNAIFIANKNAYNEKATTINEKRQMGQLIKYCEYDYERRKQEYVRDELNAIGISEKEFDFLKQKSPTEIKMLRNFEFDGAIMFFTKTRRKKLYKLIFNKLPIEKNDPQSIMSAYERNYTKKISDKSIGFTIRAYIGKIIFAFGMGFFLAYIGYTFKDGITLEKIGYMATTVAGMVATAVFSYAKGETAIKVYKNRYYIDLSNFLDNFNEWEAKNESKENNN